MTGRGIQLICLNTNQRGEDSIIQEGNTMLRHSSLPETKTTKLVEAVKHKEETLSKENHHEEDNNKAEEVDIIREVQEMNKDQNMTRATLTHFDARSAIRKNMTAHSTVPNSRNSFQEELM